ncbi:MAG: hypothetical protein Q8L60_14805 [Gammaproteobacteria bacterium]|nr:hypothetical protein [Gammaproteobacteria bacterium]MDP2142228.1 hypothetical protein [Gammaproteobacteria bacterium]MDP2347877.1 hypothetical protein [Gammaproteobacteria bacterium]
MKNESNRNKRGMSRREIVALVSSVLIVVVAVVYWGVQIDGVMEMLEMAYG